MDLFYCSKLAHYDGVSCVAFWKCVMYIYCTVVWFLCDSYNNFIALQLLTNWNLMLFRVVDPGWPNV